MLPLLSDQFHARRLPTGLSHIDLHLKGGLPSRQIIQIAGGAGAGKTQFCLHLVAQILTERVCDQSTCVVWIHTEGTFPVERLQEILACRLKVDSGCPLVLQILGRIYIDHVSERASLLYTVTNKIGPLMQQYGKSIELIVIDSIANVFRSISESDTYCVEENRPAYIQRSREFLALVAQLRSFCLTKSCFILIVNQATYHLRRDVPALGKVWNSLVDVRIWLTRVIQLQQSTTGGQTHDFTIQSAPDLAPFTGAFQIGAEGLARV
eukprot:Protomagalhaensia_sp_Gyna_25__89@NODE_1044_length_2256_cov_8_330627_g831_i0_p2_GENE_NODE_1044_length_2256_cov_8_330627_g831_i0NODE_1044_length_2256_cov_8_330627_g831_i0_p2_ORF_typecomplete_len266_score10_31Rad51/PF08423_11/1_3e40RecA/PF00154_21/5_4e19ATPase/PF06745_13/7_8e16AAA_25/PF13481_6/2_3e13NBARC/PF00931_22/6_2e07DnaB_C/PF03796_15/3e05AAA_19/PF13245_6/0_00044AAA_22/PF13401_6/0_00078AAA_24/PF13479_6/0_0021DUF2075/PF09848_9/0_0024PRK/PF00485_18/0_0054PRK/PF00485_18/3_6e03NACHT/PF05729_12/0_0